MPLAPPASASPGLAATSKRQAEVPRTFLAAPGEEARESAKKQSKRVESYGAVTGATAKGVPLCVRKPGPNGDFLKSPNKSAPAADAPSYASTGADEVFDKVASGSQATGPPKALTGRTTSCTRT